MDSLCEKYAIEAICEYVCVQLGGLYWFDGNLYGVDLCS